MKPNGRSLGMGTCRFSCSKEAKAAIAGMDGHMIQGRRQGQHYMTCYNTTSDVYTCNVIQGIHIIESLCTIFLYYICACVETVLVYLCSVYV